MDDLFAEMFGGASFSFDMGGGPSRPRKPTRGADTIVQYEMSLEEVYKGKRVVLDLGRDRTCGLCKGSGARSGVKPSTCSTCEGKGSVIRDRHVSDFRQGRG